MRLVGRKLEFEAARQMPRMRPDREPHLSLDDERPGRVGVLMHLDARERRPGDLDDFIEALRAQVLFKVLEMRVHRILDWVAG